MHSLFSNRTPVRRSDGILINNIHSRVVMPVTYDHFIKTLIQTKNLQPAKIMELIELTALYQAQVYHSL